MFYYSEVNNCSKILLLGYCKLRLNGYRKVVKIRWYLPLFVVSELYVFGKSSFSSRARYARKKYLIGLTVIPLKRQRNILHYFREENGK